MKKPLLILDLDETLIYSIDKTEYKEQSYDFIIEEQYYVKKRPHVEDFLIEMSQHFDLAVWTAATELYGYHIVKNLFIKNNLELDFYYSRKKCIERNYFQSSDDYYMQHYYLKDLHKIKKKYNLDKVLMVDDVKLGLQRNYGNLINIKPFRGDNEDNQLLLLKDYLLSIKEEDNLRKIEKRFWYEKMRNKEHKIKP